MKANIFGMLFLSVVGFACGKKSDNKRVSETPDPVATPVPVAPVIPPSKAVVATPEDSLMTCYGSTDPGVGWVEVCELPEKELAAAQAGFSKFTVTVDYPCVGYPVDIKLSTGFGDKLFRNEEPFVKTVEIYGVGPLKIAPVSAKALYIQQFSKGCYLKVTDIVIEPATAP